MTRAKPLLLRAVLWIARRYFVGAVVDVDIGNKTRRAKITKVDDDGTVHAISTTTRGLMRHSFALSKLNRRGKFWEAKL